MILVLGHQGNMGARYSAILDSMGFEWIGLDIKNGELSDELIIETAMKCAGSKRWIYNSPNLTMTVT